MDVSTEEFEAGVFFIDKPVGVSSFAMVSGVRRVLKMKKVGHAGTLDPFATGLLIICAGRKATKMISSFMDGKKEYVATLCLGIQTETLDPEGEITATQDVGLIQAETIEECLRGFVGEQEQTPPAYSALKHKGKPLYHYARKGIKISKPPRIINIEEIEWLDKRATVSGVTAEMKIRVVCGKGTYIRTLADDIGKKLGCGAYLTQLRRTQSGSFSVDNALPGEELRDSDARDKLFAQMLSVEDVQNLLQKTELVTNIKG